MAAEPLTSIALTAESRAEELALIALVDVVESLADAGVVIGGWMITIHEARWSLPAGRRTADADYGLHKYHVAQLGILDLMRRAGYSTVAGGRFQKTRGGQATADPVPTIDILVPSTTSRHRQSVQAAPGVVTSEAHGLALALRQGRLLVPARIDTTMGDVAEIEIPIPSEVTALAMKALVRRARNEAKDAHDIIRMLEVCWRAGVTPDGFEDHEELVEAATIIRREMRPGGAGIESVMSEYGSSSSVRRASTRIAALVHRVIGPPPEA